jgi:threonine 3-dehydrogenase
MNHDPGPPPPNHDPKPPVRVLFPSTIASFGQFIKGGDLVPNEAVQMPTTMYGVAKVSVERLGEYYVAKRAVVRRR